MSAMSTMTRAIEADLVRIARLVADYACEPKTYANGHETLNHLLDRWEASCRQQPGDPATTTPTA